MIRFVLVCAISAFSALAAEAQPPMTVEEVSQAARENVSFVGNDHIRSRQEANPDLLLLDVRTEREFLTGHIPGAAWMARGVVEFRVAEQVRDADAEIIVYCATGPRAALVSKALEAQGYRNVSAHEGFESWAGASEAIENAYGTLKLVERATGE